VLPRVKVERGPEHPHTLNAMADHWLLFNSYSLLTDHEESAKWQAELEKRQPDKTPPNKKRASNRD